MAKRTGETNYNALLKEILTEVQNHRTIAAQQISNTIMQLYFSIGRIIVTRQEKEGWGKSVVERLATDISKMTNAQTGFSVQNLWYMRQFYLEYKEQPLLKEMALQIPWGQNILIFSQVKEAKQREYYLSHTRTDGWSRKILLNQIKRQLMKGRANFLKPIILRKHCLPIFPSRQMKY